MASWIPKRTNAEGKSPRAESLSRLTDRPMKTLVNAILTAPGMPFELETRLVDGRLLRVYKNLWPSLRDFWLSSSTQHGKALCVVFERQRYTFEEVFGRSVRAASVFMKLYGVQKGMSPHGLINVPPGINACPNAIGDKVGICCRNYPDYLVAFWACRQSSFILPRSYNTIQIGHHNRPHWCCIRASQCVRFRISAGFLLSNTFASGGPPQMS